ncbi:DUF5050 domain-containing protein [Paenibacillus psychroresistens]|nr:DUF5050 domain-containing protein [Paenibacillus psychroresistens]
MKKTMAAIILSLALLVGILPSATAAVVDNKVIWLGDYGDKDWSGLNLTTVDGKTNTTKRLFKEDVVTYAVSGDWIYFLRQNPEDEIKAGDIMKMKKDGSKVSNVTTGNVMQNFTIEGKILYFGGYDKDYKFQLGTMNLDGSGKKILKKNIEFWSYVTTKNYIFYVDTMGTSIFYRMKWDGTAKTAISKDAVRPYDGGYAVYGDTLFYAETSKDEAVQWSLVDVTGKNKKTFKTKGSVQPIAYSNQQFFYEETLVKGAMNPVRTLTKIKRDGTAKKTVAIIATDDRFIGQVGTTFVYKTAKGKVYQISQEGKITISAK